MRLWPQSLLGQMLLAVALALLVAQTISATLLWRAGDNRREQAALNSAAFRLVTEPSRRLQRADRLRDGQRSGQRSQRGPRQRLIENDRAVRWPRALRIETASSTPLRPDEKREPDLEKDLTSILEREGMAIDDIVVLKRKATDDAFIRERPRLMRRIMMSGRAGPELIVAGVRVPGSDVWNVARVAKPPPQSGAIRTIVLQTLLIYVLLVGLHFLLLRRITRPLATLTQRTESFGQPIDMAEPLAPEGPEDVRRLIAAHNAMEARIAALLDEKDVMLGAIGHDLKTPLAALRVRIESVEDAAERSKMAGTIEDITRSLDDILSLARVGRASEPPEKAELSALVASVVEEFEDMGKLVTIISSERIVHPVHVTWLKRGLRNLIGNAVRYAGTAEITLLAEADAIILRVEDTGPGIPPGQIADMLEPFTRGEASRNRRTGGAGLGLTLARAIAEQHGGKLTLTNRPEGGLRAEIRLP